MGRNFSQRPSQLLQIEDDKLAFDFDYACTARLLVFDRERDRLQLEGMALGTVSSVLQGKPTETIREQGTF